VTSAACTAFCPCAAALAVDCAAAPWTLRKSALRRGYALHLLWDLDLPVDFLCYTPAEFHALSRRPGIVREALRDGLEIPG